MDRRTGDRFPYQPARQLVRWAGAHWQALQAEVGWATPLEDVRAPMAFAMLFERLMHGRSEAKQLEAEVWLGMPGARERMFATQDEAADRFGWSA